MIIAFGCDHGGFGKKKKILQVLKTLNLKVLDFGIMVEESRDYPDYAGKVARAVSKGQAKRGILVCGTGIGMSIAANKFKGVRAAVAWNEKIASLASEHNNANVLCLSGRFLSSPLIAKMIKTWIKTPFGGGRHNRRVKKISKLEVEACKRD